MPATNDIFFDVTLLNFGMKHTVLFRQAHAVKLILPKALATCRISKYMLRLSFHGEEAQNAQNIVPNVLLIVSRPTALPMMTYESSAAIASLRKLMHHIIIIHRRWFDILSSRALTFSQCGVFHAGGIDGCRPSFISII